MRLSSRCLSLRSTLLRATLLPTLMSPRPSPTRKHASSTESSLKRPRRTSLQTPILQPQLQLHQPCFWPLPSLSPAQRLPSSPLVSSSLASGPSSSSFQLDWAPTGASSSAISTGGAWPPRRPGVCALSKTFSSTAFVTSSLFFFHRYCT